MVDLDWGLGPGRMQLFIVGHRQTLASDGDWRKVAEVRTDRFGFDGFAEESVKSSPVP